jgi:hypothetical protein
MRKLLPLLFLAATAFAGDLTGRWSGTFEMKRPDGETRTRSAEMEFKQSGDQITGKAGPTGEEMVPIENAKLEGGKLTFSVTPPNGRPIRFTLTVVGDDKLEGGAEGEDDNGEKREAKVSLSRKA